MTSPTKPKVNPPKKRSVSWVLGKHLYDFICIPKKTDEWTLKVMIFLKTMFTPLSKLASWFSLEVLAAVRFHRESS